MKTRQIVLVVLVGILLVAGIFAVFFENQVRTFAFRPTRTRLEQGGEGQGDVARAVSAAAQDLVVPWEILFTVSPTRETKELMLVSQRDGTLGVFGGDGLLELTVPGVIHSGEGGLLGMAAHPDFSENGFLYFYLTGASGAAGRENRVMRFTFNGRTLANPTIIIDRIPGAEYHDGGELAFGSDGMLYITTGDAGRGSSAQDLSSLAGKILRLTADGTVPADNPFGTPVWTYGHRNPQGLAWDDRGRLWATEHGRSGAASGYDELNLIEKGNNYGWPLIQGQEQRDGMVPPVLDSGADETWAPAGIAFTDGALYFAGLRGESLYEVRLPADGSVSAPVAHFRKTYGRLRAVTTHGGALYVSTSNTDGRGTPREHDDKVLMIDPALFVR